MKLLLTIILAAGLVGCAAPPGVVVYQDSASPTGKALPLVAINADVIGEIEVPGRLSIKTATDGNGQFAMTQIPVQQKDGSVILASQPMVAQIKTASVWDAFFSGLAKNLDSVGRSIALGLGISALAPAVSAGAAAIPAAP
jgi:hypothetical protein